MADRDKSSGVIPEADRAEIQRKADELGKKLGSAREQDRVVERASRTGASMSGGGRGMAYGLRMASELVAAIIVGGLVGYFLDRWLGTKPWLFLVFFFVGFAAGVINVLRAYNKVQAEVARETGGNIGQDLGKGPGKDDDDA